MTIARDLIKSGVESIVPILFGKRGKELLDDVVNVVER